MKIVFTELVLELSRALDYVEAELVGVQTNHGKRVAYLCALLGKKAGLSREEQLDLAAYGVLHDNALSEYVQAEYRQTNNDELQGTVKGLGMHCALGERNVRDFPFFAPKQYAILYHHENADGSGPFRKKAEEVNLYAAIIHLADQLDAIFNLKDMTDDKWKKKKTLKQYADKTKWEGICAFLHNEEGKMFDSRETALFFESVKEEDMEKLRDDNLEGALREVLDYIEADYSPSQMKHMSGIFAKIVDYKSTFTCSHSIGIAQKADIMAKHYGLPEEMQAELYLAGALHDIGKLAVDIRILEKPGKLEPEEFEEMKKHALISYEVLSRIHGFERICTWAAYHHEKLNGKGYPFGYDAPKLGRYERLMGCLDIYQALREDRPYKAGMTHEQTMSIMWNMVDSGFIDRELTADVDKVFQDTDAIEAVSLNQ
jgi:HD-GYP domain-containing protein (c-di-GMP phosphodiesterase class II)